MMRTYTFVFNPEPEGGYTVTCAPWSRYLWRDQGRGAKHGARRDGRPDPGHAGERRAGPGERRLLTLRPPHTSTLADSAFSWMNSRRGSTSSPISLVKRSSASSTSLTFTCRRERAFTSSVVSHNW